MELLPFEEIAVRVGSFDVTIDISEDLQRLLLLASVSVNLRVAKCGFVIFQAPNLMTCRQN